MSRTRRAADAVGSPVQGIAAGVARFILSLIETAIALTVGRVAGRDLQGLIDRAKQMMTEEVELFEGAREAVAALAVSSMNTE